MSVLGTMGDFISVCDNPNDHMPRTIHSCVLLNQVKEFDNLKIEPKYISVLSCL